jgi:ATP-dependent Clp protease ATP-binding subunit ClpC
MPFTADATRVLKHAYVEAHVAGAAYISPAHILIALCKFGSDRALQALAQQAIDPVPFRRRVRMVAAQLAGSGGRIGRSAIEPSFSRETGGLLLDAERRAASANREADSADLLVAVLRKPDELMAIVIREEKLDVDRVAAAVERGSPGELRAEPKSTPTPILARCGTDLTRQAKEGKLQPLIGRRSELLQLSRALFRKEKNNVVLIGEAGVGKTRIVEGLAQFAAQDGAPEELRMLRFVAIPPGTLVAGTKHRGDLEERVSGIVKEAANDRQIVLFFDEMHALLGGIDDAAITIANLLKPPLARGELRCIGATTPDEYKRHIAKDAALARRFEELRVEEPSPAEAREVLAGLRASFETHHNVTVSDAALDAAVDLTVRYVPDRRLPDKARDALDRAAVSKRIVSLSRWGKAVGPARDVSADDVASAVAEMTGLPVARVTEDARSRLQHMEEALQARVVGQDDAVAAVTRVVRTALVGLGQPDKPGGVMLFVGPSGVGKTELARALAEFLFLDERRLLRFDMSEYMEEHSVSKLVGPPPGYVGHEDGGVLTNQVKKTPYSVVLFDEVEKAHPRIFDLFLQVFDNGRLRDGQGRTVDFRNTVILLTSNLLPADKRRAAVGFHAGETPGAPRAESDKRGFLRSHFRVELINRLSDVIEFQPLSKTHLRHIVDKLVRDAEPRLAARGLRLRLTDAAYELLIREGYDEEYGARELGRAFEQRIVQELANRWLEGEVESGTVSVDIDERGKIVFGCEPA